MPLVRALRLALAAAALTATGARAGSGAELYGCLNVVTAPPAGASWTLTFTPGGGGTYCMNQTGHPGSVTVSAPGLACAPLGYVESRSNNKKGDSCQLNPARMPLEYRSSPGDGGFDAGFHAATTLQISGSFFGGKGKAVLDGNQSYTALCPGRRACTATDITWKKATRGPLYVIFQQQVDTAPPSPSP